MSEEEERHLPLIDWLKRKFLAVIKLLSRRQPKFFLPVPHMFLSHKIVVMGKHLTEEKKIAGLSCKQINQLKGRCISDLILVEGDGANRKPFKAPRHYEPVIPESADLVVPVIGIDCIGKPLNSLYFHAPDQISILTGLKLDVPDSARWIPFINKVESNDDWEKARKLGQILKEWGVKRIVAGASGVKDSLFQVI